MCLGVIRSRTTADSKVTIQLFHSILLGHGLKLYSRKIKEIFSLLKAKITELN